MSIVQYAHEALLHDLSKWTFMNNSQRNQLCHQLYNLMGKNFITALSMLENNCNHISIVQYHLLYAIRVQKQRIVLFKNNQRSKNSKTYVFANDCNCRQSFGRKVSEKAPLLCMHQILILLVKYTDHHNLRIQQGVQEGLDQLGELLVSMK